MRAVTRLRRAVAASACVLLSSLAPALAQPPPAPASSPPPVKAELVTGKIYLLTGGGGANSTLLLTADGSLLVDTKSAGTKQTFTTEMLQSIPSARDPWVILQQTAGIAMDRENVGGNMSGQQSNYVSRGGNPTNKVTPPPSGNVSAGNAAGGAGGPPRWPAASTARVPSCATMRAPLTPNASLPPVWSGCTWPFTT